MANLNHAKRLGKGTLLAFTALLTLSACATGNDPIDSLSGKKMQTEARLATAASEAIAAGKTEEALLKYERLYGDTPKKRDIALNYAQLLRKTGKAEKAASIFEKYDAGLKEKGQKDNEIDAVMLNEYAASLIELGRFEEAEVSLATVLDDPQSKQFHADTQNLSGIALDAQGAHVDAEKMFRASMDKWKGDKSSVMNNLALSLASQGKFDEAITILREALIMAPAKKELARNIQIVTDLRDAVVAKAKPPTNIKKPEKKKKRV